MTVLDYLLDGLEAELELERELGVRSVEVDRNLLAAGVAPARAVAASSEKSASPKPAPAVTVAKPAPLSPRAAPPPPVSTSGGIYDFVFLTDKTLSAGGAEMMDKIIGAIGRTRETAPIVCEGARPRARYAIVLGSRALAKWFPGRRGAPGNWITDDVGNEVLITYSPEYILRFGEVTPAVTKIKSDMWRSLRTVMQRCRA